MLPQRAYHYRTVSEKCTRLIRIETNDRERVVIPEVTHQAEQQCTIPDNVDDDADDDDDDGDDDDL